MSRQPRPGYEHCRPASALVRAVFACAALVHAKLGHVQQAALTSCEPGKALAGVEDGQGRLYPLSVRRSLQLAAMLKSGEAWELTALGAIVREAGGTHEGSPHGTRGT